MSQRASHDHAKSRHRTKELVRDSHVHDRSRRDAKDPDNKAAGSEKKSKEPVKRGKEREKLLECMVCAEDKVPESKVAHLACGHNMCHDCLRRVFELSTTDAQHMPPKCCNRNIPIKHVYSIFDSAFKNKWNEKQEEFRCKKPVYCPTKGCGDFILPSKYKIDDLGRNYGRCRKCNTKVCAICSGIWHSNKTCPETKDSVVFKKLAKEEGWRECEKCKATVERTEGCNHMTCRCGHQFCMVCGRKWKTCSCVLFNEEVIREWREREIREWRDQERFEVDEDNVFEIWRIPEHRGRAPRNYQEEMDMRREQERADEEFARQLQDFGLDEHHWLPPHRHRFPDWANAAPNMPMGWGDLPLHHYEHHHGHHHAQHHPFRADFDPAEAAARHRRHHHHDAHGGFGGEHREFRDRERREAWHHPSRDRSNSPETRQRRRDVIDFMYD